MCVFDHSIRDFISIPPGRKKPHPILTEKILAREESLDNRVMQEAEC